MDAEKLAQQWHDDKTAMHEDAQENGDTFSDCGVCAEMNPFYDDAVRDDL